MLYGWRIRHGGISLRLEREDLASPPPTISGDEHFRRSIIDAVGQGLRRKAAEHHAVCCANSRTRQHRHCGLGDHRQVDIDAVTFFHSQRQQRVGKLLCLIKKLLIRHRSRVTRFAFPIERNFAATPGQHVAVQTVIRHVELTVNKPLSEGQVPLTNGSPRL